MTIANAARTAARPSVMPPLAGPALLAGAAAAAALTFWNGIVSLVDAWSVPEYSHGPIIPLISTMLFLRELRVIPPAAAAPGASWPGVVVVLCALALGVFGDLVKIADLVTYAMILWVAGVVLTIFGWRRGRLFWPSVLHLAFMLPLPNFLYWKVSVFLQGVSSEIGVWLVAAAGVPVYLDGNIIDLGVYKLQVAEACSGLRYLFPMLSFSYTFAVLYQGPVWHKLALLASAAPITVAMNSFRIGVIGVLVDQRGIEHAEGFLHAFEGWVIFIACVAILIGLAILLQRTSARPKPISEVLDVDFAGLGAQAARAFDVRPTAALAGVAAATLAAGLAWSAVPAREEVAPPPRSAFVAFPGEIGDWAGRRQSLDAQTERVLGADDYLSMTFRADAETAPVDLFVAFYRRQTAGDGIHSPEVCIPAGGWEVSGWSTRATTLGADVPLTVNRAIIQKGLERQLVYYWFEQRGRRFTNDFAAKAATVADALALGRTDGGLVRLVTPIEPIEGEEKADERLERFLAALGPMLPRYLPGR
jgi:exosortase D (VPLPA-CTERM-specific)